MGMGITQSGLYEEELLGRFLHKHRQFTIGRQRRLTAIRSITAREIYRRIGTFFKVHIGPFDSSSHTIFRFSMDVEANITIFP